MTNGAINLTVEEMNEAINLYKGYNGIVGLGHYGASTILYGNDVMRDQWFYTEDDSTTNDEYIDSINDAQLSIDTDAIAQSLQYNNQLLVAEDEVSCQNCKCKGNCTKAYFGNISFQDIMIGYNDTLKQMDMERSEL